MTREDAKTLLPILQAYVDKKKLQYYNCGEWTDVKDGEDLSLINYPKKYRIKPTPTYRPFANAEECWEEMKKHEPFGWAKEKGKNRYINVKRVDGEFMTVLLGNDDNWGMKGAFKNYIFADGSVFGKLAEE